jgi:tetratricopeptide (TPR) repeat protein
MKRIVLTLGVAGLVGVSLFFGGVLSGSDADGSLAVGPQASAGRLLDGFASGDTAALAAQLEARVAANPLDTKGLVLLGLAYQQRVRESGDPAFYPRSETALRRALEIEPNNALALAGLASLAASRHRFAEARELARRTLEVNPYSAATWGILGDANIETGRYGAAFAAFDRMIAIRPTASAYARISYAREMLGRTGPALAAMKRAVTAAAGTPEPAAWARVHLGNLYAETGRLAQAERNYRAALASMGDYGPAFGALARIRFWQGRYSDAAGLWRRALRAQAVPEHAIGLGDALARLGRHTEAAEAYARAERLEAAFAIYGGQNQLETALFDLDHGQRLSDALARARVGQRLRPSVEGEHVLAWALYKNGRCDEARVHSVRALRLGTKDWGAMLHRSLIESCLGDRKAALSFRERALAVNPYALAAFGSLEAHRNDR